MRELEGKASTSQTVSLLGEEVNIQQMPLPHLLGIQSQMRDDMNRINAVRVTACVASFPITIVSITVLSYCVDEGIYIYEHEQTSVVLVRLIILVIM